MDERGNALGNLLGISCEGHCGNRQINEFPVGVCKVAAKKSLAIRGDVFFDAVCRFASSPLYIS